MLLLLVGSKEIFIDNSNSIHYCKTSEKTRDIFTDNSDSVQCEKTKIYIKHHRFR